MSSNDYPSLPIIRIAVVIESDHIKTEASETPNIKWMSFQRKS